jgi:hypothetical protein
MTEKQSSIWKTAISVGLVAGGVSLLLSLVGMVAAFNERYIITGVLTMGQLLLFTPLIVGGYSAVSRVQERSVINGLLGGAVAGVFGGLILTALLVLGSLADLRLMFPNASPELYSIISFGVVPPLGYIVPLIYGAFIGLIGAGLALLPTRIRSAVLTASLWVVVLGLFRDMFALIPSFNQPGPIKTLFTWVFAPSGLSVAPAIIFFVLIGGYSYWRSGKPKSRQQRKFSEHRSHRQCRALPHHGIGIEYRGGIRRAA